MMETSPAFLHNTPYTKYGHAPSGAFDIGRWFRPSAPTYQLWSGVTEFKASKGDAHLYFNFPSDNKIELKEFKMTDILYSIVQNNLTLKFNVPKQPLAYNYNTFENNGAKQIVIDEIEANLL
jgi:hypothetical protein